MDLLQAQREMHVLVNGLMIKLSIKAHLAYISLLMKFLMICVDILNCILVLRYT